jgi:hypothetical protein
MPHSINGRQIFEQMPGPWPKSSEEVIEWASKHDEFPNRFLNELRHSLPDRTWQNWDELKREVENYTWTMPDNDEDEEETVWGGAAPEEAAPERAR